MTTVTSSTFDSDFKAYMTYSTSSTNTTFKVSISAAGVYIGCSWASYPWKTTLSATDKTSISDTHSTVNWSKGYHEVVDGSFSWTRKTSAYTVTVKVYTKKNVSGGGSGSKTVSFTVPALTKYTIKYDANGGDGAPGATYKYYGQSASLSGTKPTRTGYKFLGWSTSASATSATWSAGGTYSTNSSNTLYAVWEANTYTITLDANGGTNGSVTSLNKTYDQAVTLPTSAQSPTRQYYKFLGWSTSASATSATWSAGGTYSTNISAATKLYAVWKEDYIPPTITKLTAKRVNSSGTDDDEGVYATASFAWTNGTLSGTAITPSSIIVQCSVSGADSWSTVYTVSDFTKKTITTTKFKNGTTDLNADAQYDVRVTITDSYSTVPATTYISKSAFIIDINAAGNGMSIGESASDSESNLFNVAWDAKFKKNVNVTGNLNVTGSVSINGYLKQYGLNGINIDSTAGNWTVDISDTSHGTVPEAWVNVTQTTSGHFLTQTAKKCVNASSATGRSQKVWVRDKYTNGSWSNWRQMVDMDFLLNLFGSAEQYDCTPTAGSNYSSVSADVYRLGNVLRVHFTATRKSASGAGNITNETVFTLKITHKGKIKNFYSVSFTTGTTGPTASFQTGNLSNVDDNTLQFDVILAGTATALSSCNAYFVMPIVLDLSKF